MTNSSESDVASEEDVFPKGFLQLYSIANVGNTSDALCVFLHACMLEVGFLPKNLEENNIYQYMPDDWRAVGASKFLYHHSSCPEVFCWMTCVPFYTYVAVHGAIDNGSTQNSVYMKIRTTQYIKEDANLTDAEDVFVNSQKLMKVFKDLFCFPLLASLQEKAGCPTTFGLSITVDEIKLYILKLLPVQSVCALSSVNKDFHRVANSQNLWRHLLKRDFGFIDVQSSSGDSYKDLYRREYLKKKRTRRPFPVFDPYYIPFPMSPPRYIDVRQDLDPALQQAFPQLRDRFRPNYIFPPYDFHGWYM